jgi:hypothetical protein
MLDPTENWTSWRALDSNEASRVLSRLATEASPWFAEVDVVSARVSSLPFYRLHELVELSIASSARSDTIYVLTSDANVFWLDGDANAIHLANRAERLLLNADVGEVYLRFFLYFIRSDTGAFALLEDPEMITTTLSASEPPFLQPRLTRLQNARAHAAPMRLEYSARQHCWHAHIVLRHSNTLYRTEVELTLTGKLNMIAEQELERLEGLIGPVYPPLRPSLLSMEARAAIMDGEDDADDEDY